MQVCVLYHQDGEYSRLTEEFVAELANHTDKKISLLNVDGQEGRRKAELYDIVDYPATLVIADDGSLHNYWQGSTLPTISDVVSWLNV
ncbi:MAG TPA: hypothetical protein VMR76_00655 [Candidatus Saccharimonadia bacterium]|nr:hypothetical protein [Candidatus Saccharimonadia bacterium]